MQDGYSKREEFLNIVTHGFGFLLSLIAFPYILQKAFSYPQVWMTVSLIIYGASLMVLFLASTLYHASNHPKKRKQLKIFDHTAIYVLIAGSYSPFCLVALNSNLGWYIRPLFNRVVELGISIRKFASVNKELEPLGEEWIITMHPR